MVNHIVGLAICFLIVGIVLYLALTNNRFIPQFLKTIAQFLTLPLYPYVKYGDTVKGIGGTMAIFLGIGFLIFIGRVVIGVIKNLIFGH